LQNIDPVYFLTPVCVLILMFGLVFYWRSRRSFRGGVLLYSFIAYFGAIALKYAVQIPTINAFESATGDSPFALGTYYGIQTAAFEVGGAFLVAWLLSSRGRITSSDSESFGLGLAFWENAILLALPLLFDYVLYYAVLSQPGSGAAQTLYQLLAKDSPGLFYAPSAALPVVGYAVLERVSSLLGHLSWGMLAVYGTVNRRWGFLAAALPIGFVIDFLVPFAGTLGLGAFEAAIFAVGAVALVGTLFLTRPYRSQSTAEPRPSSNT
jgi:uncharacterized membrane protein YhfC